MGDPAEQMKGRVADLQASLALVEGVNELLDKNHATATASVESEFLEIITVLSEREEELLSQAKTLTNAKLDALQAHAHRLEALMEDLDDPGKTQTALASVPHPKVTSQLVVMPGVKIVKEQERFDRAYAGLGQIKDKKGIPVHVMFEAAASHMAGHGFFVKVLSVLASLDTSKEAELVTEDDMEMLVAMLEEFNSEAVMAEAASAVCNLCGSNPSLGRRFVAEGAIPAMLGWFDTYQTCEKVISGAAFSIGVLAQDSANHAACTSSGVVEKLVGMMKAAPHMVEPAENCLFTLAGLVMMEGSRDIFVEAEGVETIKQLLEKHTSVGLITNALKVLTAVGKGGEDYKTLCTDVGCTALAIKAMSEHSSAPRLIGAACTFLETLLQGEDSEKDRRRAVLKVLVQGGVFTHMMQAVGDFNTDQQLATTVFNVFTLFGELAKKKELTKTGLLLGSGVKNIAKGMQTHPRAQELNLSACKAITSLSNLSMEFREQLLEVNASKLVAKSLAAFLSSLEFSVAACKCMHCLADGHSYVRTEIGGAQGVWAILEALKVHDDDAITLSGLQAVYSITDDHRANQQVAAAGGAIEALTEELREHAGSVEICDLACSILESMMDDPDEVANQVKFYQNDGETAVKESAAADSIKESLLGVLIPQADATQADKCDPPRALGQALYNFLCDADNAATVPDLLDSKHERQIVDQEIVRFTAANKTPSQVTKHRLLCVDKTDITLYGGPDEKDDNVFSHIIVNYPISKVTRIRIVPDHKEALYIESAGDVVGTVVTKSPKRAKEWRDLLKRLVPLRSGPEGCKQLMMNGNKTSGGRFLSWTGHTLQPPQMMLYAHESNKKGVLSQVIKLDSMISVVATKKILSITAVLPDGAEVENKFEIASVYEADLWESFIQQYLLEKAEVDEAVRYAKVQTEEDARTELLTADELELEPEPEPEVVVDTAEDEGEGEVPEGVPQGLTMESARELERLLAEAKKALAFEETFDELGAHAVKRIRPSSCATHNCILIRVCISQDGKNSRKKRKRRTKHKNCWTE
jgi:hypothetical protein